MSDEVKTVLFLAVRIVSLIKICTARYRDSDDDLCPSRFAAVERHNCYFTPPERYSNFLSAREQCPLER